MRGLLKNYLKKSLFLFKWDNTQLVMWSMRFRFLRTVRGWALSVCLLLMWLCEHKSTILLYYGGGEVRLQVSLLWCHSGVTSSHLLCVIRLSPAGQQTSVFSIEKNSRDLIYEMAENVSYLVETDCTIVFSRLFSGVQGRCWLWVGFSPAAQHKGPLCLCWEWQRNLKNSLFPWSPVTFRCWHLYNTLPIENWTIYRCFSLESLPLFLSCYWLPLDTKNQNIA